MMITGLMSWSDLYKSKKMRVVGLWNDLPWLHNVFQGKATGEHSLTERFTTTSTDILEDVA
jgi:hypothetical protein